MNDLAREGIRATDSHSQIIHVPYEKAYEEGFEDMERRLPTSRGFGTSPGGSRPWLGDMLHDVVAWERGVRPSSPFRTTATSGHRI